jgi:HlyD family secretion protein
VTFTVDAFPEEEFRGEVGKVRLNASMTQNIVTFTVEVLTDNPDGRLLPYLTANVRFETGREENVLLVSNAALRWTPPADRIPREFRDDFQHLSAEGEAPAESGPSPASMQAVGSSGDGTTPGVLWVLEGQRLRPVHVRAGPSDGTVTRVEGDDLSEGWEIVTGLRTQDPERADASNPFAPKFPLGGRPGGGTR